ncbi:MAG: N-formylglutamate amidohydrolase [Pseudomonadota bacterium]
MNASKRALDGSRNSQANETMSLADPLPTPGASNTGVEPQAALETLYPFPFDYSAPSAPNLPLIFASPHSGRVYPDALRDALCVPLIDLKRTEDAFMDELIASARSFGAGLLTARYARGFVDLNRDPLELDRRMFDGPPPRRCAEPGPRVEAGLGCIPRVGARGHTIYARRLGAAEAEARLRDIHDAYHGHLAAELQRLKLEHGRAFLIDCHSMPSRQPGRRPLSDIVLGDRFGSSCSSKLTSLVEARFRKLGYSVSRNTPYAGGYTTLRYGRPRRSVHALQIEIRRDLYMDETRVARGDGFPRMASHVGQVIGQVARFAAQTNGRRIP